MIVTDLKETADKLRWIAKKITKVAYGEVMMKDPNRCTEMIEDTLTLFSAAIELERLAAGDYRALGIVKKEES